VRTWLPRSGALGISLLCAALLCLTGAPATRAVTNGVDVAAVDRGGRRAGRHPARAQCGRRAAHAHPAVRHRLELRHGVDGARTGRRAGPAGAHRRPVHVLRRAGPAARRGLWHRGALRRQLRVGRHRRRRRQGRRTARWRPTRGLLPPTLAVAVALAVLTAATLVRRGRALLRRHAWGRRHVRIPWWRLAPGLLWLLLPAALLAGLPALMLWTLGRAFTYQQLALSMPDVTTWLAVGAMTGLGLAAARLITLMRLRHVGADRRSGDGSGGVERPGTLSRRRIRRVRNCRIR
jgi:hypothetical protein